MLPGSLTSRQVLRSPSLAIEYRNSRPHSVLSRISPCYPQRRGRLPGRYSPFRHSHFPGIATREDPVRLACLIHAASVRSEPESNSHSKKFLRSTRFDSRTGVFRVCPACALIRHIPSVSEGKMSSNHYCPKSQRTSAVPACDPRPLAFIGGD